MNATPTELLLYLIVVSTELLCGFTKYTFVSDSPSEGPAILQSSSDSTGSPVQLQQSLSLSLTYREVNIFEDIIMEDELIVLTNIISLEFSQHLHHWMWSFL